MLKISTLTQTTPVNAFGALTYTRRLNDVGVCELIIRDERIPDWIDEGAYLSIYDGRVDAVYRLMDFERKTAGGAYIVYGEDMMHMLRDCVLRAPAGTDEAKWDGDAGALICDVLARFRSQVAPALTVGQMQCMVPMAMLPTVDISVSYSWATALEAIRDAVAAARDAGRALWVGVGSATLSPSLRWSYDVAADVWGRERDTIYTPLSEQYSTRAEITTAIGIGRGVGQARAREYRATMQAASHRMRWREARIDARNASAISSAIETALVRSAPDYDLSDPLINSDMYPDQIDLGDLITLRGGAHAEHLVVTGVRVQYDGARIVDFDFYEF